MRNNDLYFTIMEDFCFKSNMAVDDVIRNSKIRVLLQLM